MTALEEAQRKLALYEEVAPEATGAPGSEAPPEEETFDQRFEREFAEEQSRTRYLPPETLVGEFTSAVDRGWEQTKQMGTAAAAVGTGLLGMEDVSGYFREKTLEIGKELQKNPASVEDFTKIEGFDTGSRYVAATLGEFVPQIAQMFVSGGVGSIGAKMVMSKVINKKIAGSLLTNATALAKPEVAEQLGKIAAGKMARREASKEVQELLIKSGEEYARRVAKYGAQGAVAVGSAEMEFGSIYASMTEKNDPNIPESDRLTASLIFGLTAAAIETPLNSYIIGKLFKGKKPTPVEADAAIKFWNTYIGRFAKEAVKLMPAENFEEVFQTLTEDAAERWADPNKRILDISDEEIKRAMDAGVRGTIIAGPFAALTAVHPNVAVRTKERDFESTIRDTQGPAAAAEIDQTDIRIKEIEGRMKELETQKATIGVLTPEAAKTIGDELTDLEAERDLLTSVKAKSEEELGESLEKEKERITKEFTELKTKNVVTQTAYEGRDEKRTAVQTNLQDVAVKATENAKDKATADAFAETLRTRLGDDSIVDFLAVNNIAVEALPSEAEQAKIIEEERKAGKKGARTEFGEYEVGFKNGRLTIFVPHVDQAVSADISKSPVRTAMKLAQTETSLVHELLHAADYVTLIDEYGAMKGKERAAQIKREQTKGYQYDKDVSPEENYVTYRIIKRGKALSAALPHLPVIANIVYAMEQKAGKKLSNQEMGDEVMRMALELARQGKISDVTEAMIRAQKEAEGSTKGIISDFLKVWFDAIRQIKDALLKLIDPKTSPPEFLSDLDAIQGTLNKFGLLVPEDFVSPSEAKEAAELEAAEEVLSPKEKAAKEELVTKRAAAKAEIPSRKEPTKRAAGAEPVVIRTPVTRHIRWVQTVRMDRQIYIARDIRIVDREIVWHEPGTPEDQVVPVQVNNPILSPSEQAAYNRYLALKRAADAALVAEESGETLSPAEKQAKAEYEAAKAKLQPTVELEIESNLTEEEKQEAAVELGFPQWDEDASLSFQGALSDWMVGQAPATQGRTISQKLADIFSRLWQRIKAGLFAAVMAVSIPTNTADSTIITQQEVDRVMVPTPTAVAEPAMPSFETGLLLTKPEPTRPELAQPQIPPIPFAIANFGDTEASGEVIDAANYVMTSKDNNGKPFSVVDKVNAEIYVFDADGNLEANGPVLLGMARADQPPAGQSMTRLDDYTTPDKVTPAGRFPTTISETEELGRTVDLRTEKGDYVVSMHRVYVGEPSERRPQRLKSKSPADNRISFGCINCDPSLMNKTILPLFENGGTVYVLPETEEGGRKMPARKRKAPAMARSGRRRKEEFKPAYDAILHDPTVKLPGYLGGGWMSQFGELYYLQGAAPHAGIMEMFGAEEYDDMFKNGFIRILKEGNKIYYESPMREPSRSQRTALEDMAMANEAAVYFDRQRGMMGMVMKYDYRTEEEKSRAAFKKATPRPDSFKDWDAMSFRSAFSGLFAKRSPAGVLEALRINTKPETRGWGEFFEKAKTQLAAGVKPINAFLELANGIGMRPIGDEGGIVVHDPAKHEDTVGGLMGGEDKAKVVLQPGIEFTDDVIYRAQVGKAPKGALLTKESGGRKRPAKKKKAEHLLHDPSVKLPSMNGGGFVNKDGELFYAQGPMPHQDIIYSLGYQTYDDVFSAGYVRMVKEVNWFAENVIHYEGAYKKPLNLTSAQRKTFEQIAVANEALVVHDIGEGGREIEKFDYRPEGGSKGIAMKKRFDGMVLHTLRNNEDLGTVLEQGLKRGTNVSMDAGKPNQSLGSGVTLVYDPDDIRAEPKGYNENDGIVTSSTKARPKAILIESEEVEMRSRQTYSEDVITDKLGEIADKVAALREQEAANPPQNLGFYGRSPQMMALERQQDEWFNRLEALTTAQEKQPDLRQEPGVSEDQALKDILGEMPTDIPIFVYDANEDGEIENLRQVAGPEFLLTKEEEGEEPSGGAKTPARKIAVHDQPKINRITKDIDFLHQREADQIVPNKSRERQRGGWNTLSSQELYYSSQPIGESLKWAVEQLKGKDIIEAAEEIKKDPSMSFLNAVEDSIDEDSFGGKSGAYIWEVEHRIKSIRDQMDSTYAVSTRDYVTGLADEVEFIGRRQPGTSSGQRNVTTGRLGAIWGAASARRSFVDVTTILLDKIIGVGSKQKLNRLAGLFNGAMAKAAPTAAISKEVVKILLQMQKLVNKSNFDGMTRKQISETFDDVRTLVRKPGARMASYQAYSAEDRASVNKAIEGLVDAMSGVQKVGTKVEEIDVFNRTLAGFVRKYAAEIGRIIPANKDKRSTLEQMAVILKNYSMYEEFANMLHDEYVKEYSSKDATGTIAKSAVQLKEFLLTRGWEGDMVKKVVNEKFRENEVKLREIAKTVYATGTNIVDKLTLQVKNYLARQGINDDALVDKMVEDIETEMNARVNAARSKFFGSTKTVKEFLREKSKKLSDMVLDLSVTTDKIHESFRSILMSAEYAFPEEYATKLADEMIKQLDVLTEKEKERILDNWVKKSVADPQKRGKVKTEIQKLRGAIGAGVFHSEDLYNKLQKPFSLPAWNKDMAAEIEELGRLWTESKSQRQRNNIDQEITQILANAKGFSTWASYESWMYMSMLSALVTQARNALGTSFNLMGYFAVETIKAKGNPFVAMEMMKAAVKTAMEKGQLEMRQAWATGLQVGRDDSKWIPRSTAIESPDPYFSSTLLAGTKLQKADETFAKWLHQLSRGKVFGMQTPLKGQYVGRALIAADILFRKVAEEVAYTRRVGVENAKITPEVWDSAKMEAENEMRRRGKDPDGSTKLRRETKVLAHSIAEELRLQDKYGTIIPERAAAWTESRSEGLDVTFNQEPKGWLGGVHRMLKELSYQYPGIKAIVPFTQVAANVTNALLDWTPYGFVRWGLGHFYLDDFRVAGKDGKPVRNQDIFIRSALGVGITMMLMAMAGADADDEDPHFAIYGNGPRDPEARKILREKGWKPNSLKIGHTYWSYLQTPVAMALSMLGKQFDDYRDGKIQSMYDLRLATMSVALLEAVKEQSFISSMVDIASAVDGPDPERSLGKVVARTATLFIPNVFKSTDKFIDPTLQQSEGFFEQFLKEVPAVRHVLKPALNVFGQPIYRMRGFIPLPGLDNIASFEKTNDPVLNLISEKRVRVPGYSASARINNNPIGEHRYEYIQIAGPRVYARIQANLPLLRRMTQEELNDEIEKYSREEKEIARRTLERKYPEVFKKKPKGSE